jgi:hypothetical protein
LACDLEREGTDMAASTRRNRLLPWFIGVAIIAVMDFVTGYLFFATGCRVPGAAQVMVLIAMPVVYLTLMYLVVSDWPEKT